MSVYFDPAKKGWRYNFQYLGQRHQPPRPFPTREEALDAEAQRRRFLRREAAGLEEAPAEAQAAPDFTTWAGVYFAFVERQHRDGHLKRPDIIKGNLNKVLEFWGARPTDPAEVAKGAPYHDLRLDAPLLDPEWFHRFDAWMNGRGLAKSTRRHYLNTVQRLYWLSQQPDYRIVCAMIAKNPLLGTRKPKSRRRTATVTKAELLRWLAAASYHIRLALSIAALAPKLRLANILALEWDRHLDLDAGTIRVDDHKTDDDGQPLISPITSPLRAILDEARARHPHASHVVWYRGGPLKYIDEGCKAAALEAGLRWGRADARGVTFHTLRHSMATLMATMDVGDAVRTDAMGWRDSATAAWYTHLNVSAQVAPLEALGASLDLVETVNAPRRRAARTNRQTRGLAVGPRAQGAA